MAQFCVFHHRVNKILKLQQISRDQIVFLINARRTAAESGLCKVHSRGRRAIVKSCFLTSSDDLTAQTVAALLWSLVSPLLAINTQVLEVRSSPGDEFIPARSGGFVPRCSKVEKKDGVWCVGAEMDAQITGAAWVSVM